MDRLTMLWWWLEAWRRVSQCLSTQAAEVLARQPSTYAYMQDVQCIPLSVVRRNGISSESSTHRYLNSPFHCLQAHLIGQAEVKMGTTTVTRSMYLFSIFVIWLKTMYVRVLWQSLWRLLLSGMCSLTESYQHFRETCCLHFNTLGTGVANLQF
jgi:hypothetical protein